jgi:hypothetical protein
MADPSFEQFLPIMCGCSLNLIFAAITGVVAKNKGRNVLGWTLLGLLGWVPLVIVAVLPNLKEQEQRDAYIAEENRRLREQLRQERIKGESFRQHTAARLDAHDDHLGLDTRQLGPALTSGDRAAPQLSDGITEDTPRWYYGISGQTRGPVTSAEIIRLIQQSAITRDTLLWSEELVEWKPAGQVGFFHGHFL